MSDSNKEDKLTKSKKDKLIKSNKDKLIKSNKDKLIKSKKDKLTKSKKDKLTKSNKDKLTKSDKDDKLIKSTEQKDNKIIDFIKTHKIPLIGSTIAAATALSVASVYGVLKSLKFDKKIRQIACGLYHSAIVTTDGEVYTFGSNEYGQLCLGHTTNKNRPTKVNLKVKVNKVECGYNHTAILLENEDLVICGDNSNKQSSNKQDTHILTFDKPSDKHYIDVRYVYCGGNNTVYRNRFDSTYINTVNRTSALKVFHFVVCYHDLIFFYDNNDPRMFDNVQSDYKIYNNGEISELYKTDTGNIITSIHGTNQYSSSSVKGKDGFLISADNITIYICEHNLTRKDYSIHTLQYTSDIPINENKLLVNSEDFNKKNDPFKLKRIKDKTQLLDNLSFNPLFIKQNNKNQLEFYDRTYYITYKLLHDLNNPIILENSIPFSTGTHPNNVKYISIASLDNHTLFLTMNQKVQVRGNNQYGQLGLGHFNTDTLNDITELKGGNGKYYNKYVKYKLKYLKLKL
jgi:hypothetical protein